MIKSILLPIGLLFLLSQPSLAQPSQQRQQSPQTPPTSAPATTPAPVPDEPPVNTNHEIKLGERTIKYTVSTGMLPIKNVQTGETEARMFFMAYTLAGVTDPSKRPLNLDPSLKPNIKTAYYEAGHMMYIDVKSLAKLKQDVAAFIQGAIPSK